MFVIAAVGRLVVFTASVLRVMTASLLFSVVAFFPSVLILVLGLDIPTSSFGPAVASEKR